MDCLVLIQNAAYSMCQTISDTLGHEEREVGVGQDTRYVHPLVLQSVVPYFGALHLGPYFQELFLSTSR